MKCPNCGFTPNLGDQVCMKCGTKLSSTNAIIPGVDKVIQETTKKTKSSKKQIIIVILFFIFILIAIGVFFI